MKIGVENRRTVAIAAVLMVIGVFLFVRMIVGWESTPAVKAAPAPSAVDVVLGQTQAATPNGRAKQVPALPTLDPRLRLKLLAQSEEVKYEGRGRNIFRAEAEPEIPKPNPGFLRKQEEQRQAQQPPAPPPPPPIPLKFFGFASAPGAPRKVFLSEGDDVFIAGEGEVVDRRYRVVKINAMSVEIEDVLSNNRQTIPLTQG